MKGLKEFEFSLEVLLKVKSAEQKKLDYELHNINNRLLDLKQELEEIEKEKENRDIEIQTELEKGVNIHNLKNYGAYRTRLFQMSKLQISNIEAADRKANALRKDYITLKKELDMLDGLRQRQFDMYLYDMAQKQAKEIEDIISYKIVRGAEHDNV